jgi:ABC-2 type transport system permease protein
MTLWRLEWLRLARTRRLVALLGVYAFFGLLGPITARYLGEILERFGGDDVQITFPDPVPADGIAQFIGNVSQIGILVAVAIGAGALVLDALPEMSIFLRTRVHPGSRILVPRLVVVFLAVAGAYTVGLGIAWYETAVLLGGLSIGAMFVGLLFQLLYIGFALAVVAAVGSRSSSVLGTVGVAVVVLLIMPLVGVVESIGHWLPSHLVGAQVALLTDAGAVDYLPAALITVAVSASLVFVALRSIGRREL